MQQATASIIAPQMACNPGRACAIVLAPNVGLWGNMFHEDEIRKHCDEVEKIFQVADSRLAYRRITLTFSHDSIPSNSNRAAMHHGWMLLSDQTTGTELKSEFVKSALWIRRSALNAPMLESRLMVDPTQESVLQTATSGQLSNKAARRRQWMSGWEVPAALHDQIWSGMAYDSQMVAHWYDLFGYDPSLSECIMRRMDSKWPRQQVVTTIFGLMPFSAETRTVPKNTRSQESRTG